MFKTVSRRLFSSYTKSFINLSCTLPNIEVMSVTTVKTFRFKHSFSRRIHNESVSVRGSRYVPPSPLENAQEFIASTLSNKISMTDEDWDDFKSELMDREDFISEENFSSIVMNSLLYSNQIELSHNFLKYVESGSVKPNFLTYLIYISLCSKNRRTVDQEHILKMLDKVIKQIDSSPVLDMKRAEHVIQGLCATDRWRDSFKYLDKLVKAKPNREICSALACAAIRNNDQLLAWNILTKWMNSYDFVSDAVIEEFLLEALKIQKVNGFESDILIRKLFLYMQERDIIMSIDVAKLVEQYFLNHRRKWDISYSKVSRKGICEKCDNTLKLSELGNKEFKELCDSFLQRAVLKSDVYINTNIKELENYQKFIERHKPFHIVLDGLNAAYTGHSKKWKSLSLQLLDIVKKMSGRSRKILVLGRKHMKNWPLIDKVSLRAQLFFTDNISQDDPFVLYAALASGPHTLFLSGDLMRDHMSRLDDPRLMHLFKRWQLSHQMFVQTDRDRKITFIEPVRHGITIQGDMEEGWHIPFDDKIILDPYEELNNWLCIKAVV